jgi:ribose 5-phosphate isomerase A
MVQDGMTVGLGSGSTAVLMVQFLAARVKQEGLRIIAVASSGATATLASTLQIPLRELDEVAALDINLDGADEIDAQFRMIKGRGGALLREKIVASSAMLRVTMITQTKRVSQLGLAAAIPVEVSTFGLMHTERLLADLGAATAIRRSDDALALTDGGNAIIDCKFPPSVDVESLDARLQCLAGVLETGLFIGLCDTLIVGSNDGVEIIRAGVRERH